MLESIESTDTSLDRSDLAEVARLAIEDLVRGDEPPPVRDL